MPLCSDGYVTRNCTVTATDCYWLLLGFLLPERLAMFMENGQRKRHGLFALMHMSGVKGQGVTVETSKSIL